MPQHMEKIMLSVSVAPITLVSTSKEILETRSTAMLLALFNNLNTKLKQPVIKSWKEPKAKLIARIIKAQKAIAEANTHVIKPAVAKGADMSVHPTKKTKLRKQIEKAVKGKSTKSSKTKTTSTPRDTELSKYLAAQGITPRNARIRFRRLKVKKVDGHYVLNAETKKALAK